MADDGPAINFTMHHLHYVWAESRRRSIMLLQEDARALDILRDMDADALERCDDTVRLGLVLQVPHARLALQQLLCFVEVEFTRLDALEDAVLLGVLARVDQGRAGEAGGRCNSQKQRSKNNGPHHNSPLRCCRGLRRRPCRRSTCEHAQDGRREAKGMCALSRIRVGLQMFNGTEDEWNDRIASG